MSRLKDLIRALGDLFLPRECVVCGRPLGLHERHLCLSCAADVPYTRFWLQAHNPLADRFNAVLERHRGTEPMDYAYAAALMYYKGAYRNIPRALKYHYNLSVGRFYGTLLGRRLAAAPHFSDIDLIIPVPLHWTRRWSRGYNQAETLAQAIAVVLNASCRTDLLVRSRRTRTQTKLSVEEKARNVASAFRVPERFPLWHRLVARLIWLFHPRRSRPGGRRPIGVGHDGNPHSGRILSLSKEAPESPASILASARHILLLDDTFTTGATLYACYAALRPFTTARISIATLAAVEGTPSSGP